MINSDSTLAIIGLGYVGLPLAVEFGKHRQAIGFDINAARIEELKAFQDRTREVEPEELAAATHLTYTTELDAIRNAQVYIVTVPTPIDAYKRPDLTPLLKASETVGKVLKKGDTVIYESTVYPGATEENCVPVLERVSGLRFNKDFFCGYSPERINPGDRQHRLPTIVKVTSGSTEETAAEIAKLYGGIIEAGIWRAPSIKVAEAAKVIENAQRDLNIAFMNELSIIFDKLEIDTMDVLAAAGTKWNFLKFKPGLVGGHCIGIDPYYLTHKAQETGYHPEIILAGRKLNDSMPGYVAKKVVELLLKGGNKISVETKILCLGATFKEDCPDIRNSKALVLCDELHRMGLAVDLYDPVAQIEDANALSGSVIGRLKKDNYDCVILAVPHDDFLQMGPEEIRAFGTDNAVFIDLKSVFPKDQSTWRL